MSDEPEPQEDKGILGKGLDKLGDKAKETAKKGVKTVSDKTKEVASKGAQKIGEKADEMIKEAIAQQEMQDQTRGQEPTSRTRGISDIAGKSSRNIENQVRTWEGWFWSTIAYGFIIILAFVISSADSRFALLPIVLLIGFPFYLYYAIINSIPEIKIGNRVIFSRKDLSVRQQLSFSRKVAQIFSREMIENSPLGAFIIFSFLALLAYVLISPFL